MSSRARITLGIALLLLVGGVIVREIPWLAWPLTFVGIFLVIWGRAPSKTERVIAQLPGGKFLLTGLDQVDMILMPRDRELEGHLRKKIEAYDTRRRATLKDLLTTRHAASIGSDWTVFNQDGLVDHNFAGPGPIKEEFRDPIKRILRDLGV